MKHPKQGIQARAFVEGALQRRQRAIAMAKVVAGLPEDPGRALSIGCCPGGSRAPRLAARQPGVGEGVRGESGRELHMVILGVSPVVKTLSRLDDASRTLDLFDTFEGKPPRHPGPTFAVRVAADRTFYFL